MRMFETQRIIKYGGWYNLIKVHGLIKLSEAVVQYGGVSPNWSSSGSFSFSLSEEGSLELLEDMWASKTFITGEGETGFSTSCVECLTFTGSLVLT